MALSAPQDPAQEGSISIEEQRASITNGKIRAELTVNPWGKALQITFYDQKGKVLLQEIPNGGALQKKASGRRRVSSESQFRVRSGRKDLRYGTVPAGNL